MMALKLRMILKLKPKTTINKRKKTVLLEIEREYR